MNQKEKQRFLLNGFYLQAIRLEDLKTNDALLAYSSLAGQYFDGLPSSLFKYKNFSNEGHVFEMLEQGYLYFSGAEKQNDQFECLVSLNKEKIASLSEAKMFRLYRKAVINTLLENVPGLTRPVLEDIVRKVVKNGEIDEQEVSSYLSSNCPKECQKALPVIHQCLSKEESYFQNEDFTKPIVEAIDELPEKRKHIGICSLSETNGSQVMWDYYANHYNGCCIEYDFSRLSPTTLTKPFGVMALPVLYTKKRSNDLLESLLVSMVKSFLLSAQGKMDYSYLFSFLHVFFEKNSEWSFEREWRILLVDSPLPKVVAPPIKAVYLGKSVAKDSNNRDLVLSIAKQKGFSVFEQSDDFDHLSFTFRQIVL